MKRGNFRFNKQRLANCSFICNDRDRFGETARQSRNDG